MLQALSHQRSLFVPLKIVKQAAMQNSPVCFRPDGLRSATNKPPSGSEAFSSPLNAKLLVAPGLFGGLGFSRVILTRSPL